MADILAIKRFIAENSTEKARAFSMKLIPTAYAISGMQAPAAKVLTKRTLKGEFGEPLEVLKELPDDCYESIGLQGAIVASLKMPLAQKKTYIDAFVKKIDNWATNDSFVSLINVKNEEREEYFAYFAQYAKGEGEFPIRFGVTGLMDNYLDDEHIDEVLAILTGITDTAYYVKMAVAWTVATALAKQYDKTIKLIENGRIADKWTHNKSIQKAIESYRITDEQKTYLRTLKIK